MNFDQDLIDAAIEEVKTAPIAANDYDEDLLERTVYLGRVWNVLTDHHNPDHYEDLEEYLPSDMWVSCSEGDGSDFYLFMRAEE